MNCPKCGEHWGLYKETLYDGKVKICCLNNKCCYESEPIERHEALKLLNIDEIKKEWH